MESGFWRRWRCTRRPARGTARWLDPDSAVAKFAYTDTWLSGKAWIGEALTPQGKPLGYADDRHVCLVSGSRGGKGVGVIVPNL
jgi:type IV secretory pathway TraG/TraD family ATPase VirD4